MYKGTGHKYKILSSECKMKHPVTREWVEAVIYQSLEGELVGKVWIRELQEFLEKFEIL